MVSPEYLQPGERVLIIDDFLASARTIRALANLIEKRGAVLVGIGAVIEKVYENGRKRLADFDVPIITLAKIEDLSGNTIVFSD
jgi:xanthine phosphoribosyltransferase